MSKISPEIDEFDLFEERVKALLNQWRDFKVRQPNFNPAYIVANCMAEICDNISKGLTVRDIEQPNWSIRKINKKLIGLVTSETHGVTKGKHYNCTSEFNDVYIVQLDTGVYGCRPKRYYTENGETE